MTQNLNELSRRSLGEIADFIGIPIETLAALKAGTWKAVPVEPTEEMLDPANFGWSPDEYPTLWHAMIAVSPEKPE